MVADVRPPPSAHRLSSVGVEVPSGNVQLTFNSGGGLSPDVYVVISREDASCMVQLVNLMRLPPPAAF